MAVRLEGLDIGIGVRKALRAMAVVLQVAVVLTILSKMRHLCRSSNSSS